MARTMTMGRTGNRSGRTEYSAAPSTQELDGLAHWLDSKFSVLGIRFGVDSMLGLVPGVGDLAGLCLSSYIIGQGYRMGARKRTLARMAANVAGDTLIGSIPIVGSIVDVFWKANRRNMHLLRRDLERSNAVRRS